ncbi:GNAT family N-acetyltransferase [Candidatus Poribacteria bacterium]|nr:GNAT family N-acetyltransferase [Candidatus Poribacteria bacterium]
MLPRWMQTWRQAFKPDDELCVCLIKMDKDLIGVAPLSINGMTASFVGCADVCDYMDFTVAPGYEKEFYNVLLDNLQKRCITELDLRCLRPESTVFSHLVETAQERDGVCSFEPDGVSLEMDLPGDWNEYLNSLNGKQRHEIRRKLRRLHEKTDVSLLVLENPEEIAEYLDAFLKMFRESRSDKAAFMDPRMESFFRSMIRAMSEEGVLRLFVLRLFDLIAAAAVCFDYQKTMYLYNSGYDPRYASLSAGLLCKILSIKHSIEIGRKKYDFLKGAEPYKYRLGGREVRLSRCRITIKP